MWNTIPFCDSFAQGIVQWGQAALNAAQAGERDAHQHGRVLEIQPSSETQPAKRSRARAHDLRPVGEGRVPVLEMCLEMYPKDGPGRRRPGDRVAWAERSGARVRDPTTGPEGKSGEQAGAHPPHVHFRPVGRESSESAAIPTPTRTGISHFTGPQLYSSPGTASHETPRPPTWPPSPAARTAGTLRTSPSARGPSRAGRQDKPLRAPDRCRRDRS